MEIKKIDDDHIVVNGIRYCAVADEDNPGLECRNCIFEYNGSICSKFRENGIFCSENERPDKQDIAWEYEKPEKFSESHIRYGGVEYVIEETDTKGCGYCDLYGTGVCSDVYCSAETRLDRKDVIWKRKCVDHGTVNYIDENTVFVDGKKYVPVHTDPEIEQCNKCAFKYGSAICLAMLCSDDVRKDKDNVYWKESEPNIHQINEDGTNRKLSNQEIYELMEKNERVNHPIYYNWLKDICGIEVIDIVRHMSFNLGNVIKYVLRSGHKSEQGMDDNAKRIEDLKKAMWYLDDEIKMLEK